MSSSYFSIDSAIASNRAQELALESQAKELDDRLAKIPGIPAGWLQQRRKMGELRNPWSDGWLNLTAQEALLKWEPAADLRAYLARTSGRPLNSPNYEAIEAAKKAALADQAMADWVVASRKAREALPTTEQLAAWEPGFGYAKGVKV